MSIANPLTAGTEIAINSIRVAQDRVSPPSPGPDNSFKSDIFTISRAAVEKRQRSAEINSAIEPRSQVSDKPARDSVSVSTSAGRSRTSGNLTRQKAIALYQKIVGLL